MRRDGRGLVMSGSDESASGQMVGFSEQAAGTLVYGRDSRFIEDGGFHAGDGQVMFEVISHPLAVDAFQMASGDDARCQGQGGSVHEFIDKVSLPCQDKGKPGLGILFELAEDFRGTSGNTTLISFEIHHPRHHR